MRLRSVALVSLLVTLAGLIGCGTKATTDKPPLPNVVVAQSVSPDTILSPLFPPVAAPTYPHVVARRDPIVISNALVQFEERQVISAEVDGTIEVFATPIPREEIPKLRPGQLVYHPRDTKQEFPMKRVDESDEVKVGQILALMDDRQIDARIRGSKEIKASADVALKFAKEGAN
jgi:hypothetical protein